LDDGKLSEEEAESLILGSVQDWKTAADQRGAHDENKLSFSAKDLVCTLNSQIQLRAQGNHLYGRIVTNLQRQFQL